MGSLNIGKIVIGLIGGLSASIAIQHFKNVGLSKLNENDKARAEVIVGLSEAGVGLASLLYGIKTTDLLWKSVNIMFGASEIINGGESFILGGKKLLPKAKQS